MPPFPRNVRVFGIQRRGRADGRQHGCRMRTLHRHACQQRGDVFQRHIVGDNVFIQMAEDALASFGLGIQQEPVFQAEQVDVGQDVPLRVQKEGVASGAWGKLLHMVGSHGVQQAGAVVAGGVDAPAGGEVEPGCGVAQRVISGRHVP